MTDEKTGIKSHGILNPENKKRLGHFLVEHPDRYKTIGQFINEAVRRLLDEEEKKL